MQLRMLPVLLFAWVADAFTYSPVWVTVPNGSVSVGTGSSPEPWSPQRTVAFDMFKVAATEVSNSDFVTFLKDYAATQLVQDPANPQIIRLYDTTKPEYHMKPLMQVSLPGTTPGPLAPQIIDNGPTAAIRFSIVTGKENFPVNWVSYYGAALFAEKGGFALPTVVEWEAAAGQAATYAMGNTLVCMTNAVCATTSPEPINSAKSSVTTVPGASDSIKNLVGNVAEWTVDNEGNTLLNDVESTLANPVNNFGYDAGKAPDTMQKYYNRKVAKGGSFSETPNTLPPTRKHRSYSYTYMGSDVGFRVVAPSNPSGKKVFVPGVLEECAPREYQLPVTVDTATRKVSVVCAPCHSSCESCFGSQADQCLTCPGNVPVIATGSAANTCPCPTGYTVSTTGKCLDSNQCGLHQFWDQGTCNECDQLCKTCANSFSQCTSCPVNAVIAGTSGCQCAAGYMMSPLGCVSDGSMFKCAHGYYKTATSACIPCDPKCRDCDGTATTCTMCWPSATLSATNDCTCLATFILGSNGKCVCPAGTFSSGTACVACDSSCLTCGTAATQCLSCGANKVLMNNSCVCVTGMTLNVATGVCSPPTGCADTCATCYGNLPTQCLTCSKTGQTLQSDGSCDCPPRQYYITTPAIACKACHASCMRCYGPDALQCIKCSPHATLQTDSSCKCDLFYMMDAAGNCVPKPSNTVCTAANNYLKDNGTCGMCDVSCQTCLGPLASHCMTCRDPAKLQSIAPGRFNFGFCQCSDKQFMSVDGICIPCHGSCKKCTGAQATQCIGCEIGFTYDITSNQCVCPTGLSYKDGACVKLPASGSTCTYFQYGTSCANCKPPCTSCTSDTACAACSPPRVLTGTQCLCGSGFFADAWGQCQPCHASCKTCTGGSDTQCINCSPFRQLVSNKCECDPALSVLSVESKTCILTGKVCPAGSYKTERGDCVQCHPSCKECVGPTERECVACNLPARLNTVVSPLFGECACDVGMYYDYTTGTCGPCHSSCGDCSGPRSFECLACGANAVLAKTEMGQECQCISGFTRDTMGQCSALSSSCASRMFMNPTNNQCSACDSLCLSCQGAATKCTSCVFPFTLVNGICQCPPGMGRAATYVGCYSLPDVNCKVYDGKNCTACFENSYLDTTGICRCNAVAKPDISGECHVPGTSSLCFDRFYLDSVSLSCKPCHQSCATCTGPSSTDCKSCPTGRVRTTDGFCSCGSGTFLGSDGGCYQCISGCSRCTGPSIPECQVCFGNLIMMATGGCFCPDTTTEWSNKESACTPLRHNLQCAINQYMSATGTCSLCPQTCSSCTGPESDKCIQCVSPFTKMQMTTATAVTFKGIQLGACGCGVGQFNNGLQASGLYECLACAPNCANCQGSAVTQCFACVENAKFNPAGGCDCIPGYSYLTSVRKCIPMQSEADCGYAPKKYKTATGACDACNPKCLTCSGPLNTDCKVCDPALGYSVTDCTQCAAGFYLSGGACAPCDQTCATCTATSCLTCISATNMSTSGKTCACASGTAWNSSSKQCLTVGTCPSGTFGNGTTCTPCISQCASCFGPSMSECVQCIAPFVLINGSCQCTDGSFFDTVTNGCGKCSSTCKRCVGFADNCLECNSGFVIQANFTSTATTTTTATSTTGAITPPYKCRCPINTVLSGVTCTPVAVDTRCTVAQYWAGTACLTCPTTGVCTSCIINAQTCLSCKAGFITMERYDGTVECKCPGGKFLSAATCADCNPTCAECFGSAATDCSRCRQGLIYSSGSCVCPSGSAWDTTMLQCVASGIGTCGYGKYSAATGCQNCHASCASCTGSLATQCSGCDPGRNLVKDTTNSCVCQSGFFLQTSAAVTYCQPCDRTCLTCSGYMNTQCLTCPTGRVLTTGTDKKCVCAATHFDDGSGKCLSLTPVTTCGTIKFQDDDGICKPCHLSCLSCLGPESWHCTSCAGASYTAYQSFLPALKRCACSAGMYFTGSTCWDCSNTCKECYGGADYQCSVCKSHAHFVQNPKGSSCECDIGFSRLSGSSDCTPQPTATGCKTAAGAIETNTLGKYMKADGFCGTCHANCWTCLGPNDYDCVTCHDGAYLKYFFDTVTNNLDSTRGSCLCYDYGQYRNAAGGCSQCMVNCSKCHGPAAADCDACGSFSVMSGTGCTCQPGAAADPQGYCVPTGTSDKCYYSMYFDTAKNACAPCHSNCLTCSGPMEGNCASCYQDHTLVTATDGSKSCKCSSGFYPLPTSGSNAYLSCGKCFSTCLTCSGPGHDNCLSCPGATGAFVLTEGKCQCPTGKYYSPITKSCLVTDPTQVGKFVSVESPAVTLSPCHASCVSCLGATANDCTVCGIGGMLQLVGGSVDSNPSTATGTSTMPTNTTATMVYNFGRGFCYCTMDYFPDFSGRCFKCDSACVGCKGPSAYDCATCRIGFEWVPTATGFMCGCPENRKLNPATGVCDPISIFSTCSVNQYADASGSCKPCSPLCTSCVGPNDSQCATCPPGSMLNSTSIGTVDYGKCVCSPYAFLDLSVSPPVCSKCNMLCLTCFGPSELECSSCDGMRELTATTTGQKRCNCKAGYKEDIVAATCIPVSGSTQCPYDKYPDAAGACLPCDPKCTSCAGAGAERCLSCNINLGFFLAKVSGANYGPCKCPVDMFIAPDGGCQKCHPSCKTCYGAGENQCSSCFAGSSITSTTTTTANTPCICSSGTVYDQTSYRCINVNACPAGKFVDESGSCTKSCSPLCATCGGPGNQRCGTCASGYNVKTPSDIPGLTTCLCQRHSFLNVTTGTCDTCDPTCGDCTGPAPFHCLSCPDSRVLNVTIFGHECVCALGYTLTSSGCVPMGSSSFCAVNQYQDTTGACKPCHSNCLSCKGPGAADCLICGPFSMHPASTATVGDCVCLAAYYRAGDGTCMPCTSSCATCSAASTCDSCRSDRYLTGTNTCDCQTGWQADAAGKCQPKATDVSCKSSEYKTATGCQPCLSECMTCLGPSASDCSSCDYINNKKLNILNAANNSGMCTCKDGFFFNTVTRACEKCHPACLQCSGPMENQCTLCPVNSNLASTPTGQMCMCSSGFLWTTLTNRCESATACTAGTYLAGVVGTTKSCLACHSSCATCTGPNPLDCLTCKDATMTYTATAGCQCLSGKYNSNGVCAVCDITCSTCHGPSQLDCDRCKDNASFQTATLATGSFKTCVCNTNYEANNAGDCVVKKMTTCAANNQYVKADGTCASCHALCGGCYGPGQDQCFYCVSPGTVFQSRETINNSLAGKCACAGGFFLSGTACTACNPACKECTGSLDTQCVVCAQYFVKDSTGKCVCSYGNTPCQPVATGLCLFGFFNTGTNCQPCISDCESCIGPSASECLTCKSEDRKVLIKSTSGVSGFCQCLPGFFMESGMCKACDPSCETCTAGGTNSCLTCKSGAIPLNPGAASPCVCKDSSYVLSPVTNTCIQKCTDATKQPNCTALCVKPCSSCIGPNSNECLTCVTPWVPVMQTGTSAVKCACPEGTWFDPLATTVDVSCVACAKACSACFGPSDKQCTKCKVNSTLNFIGTESSCPCNTGYSRNTVGDCVPVGTSTVCPPNNYMEATTGTCKTCHASCLTCFGPGPDQCQLCPTNGIITTAGTCMCKPGYWTTSTYICEPCAKTCVECKGSATVCTKCDTYSVLASGGVCQCVSPYVPDSTGLCRPVSSGCAFPNQFKNSDNFCVMCDSTCETCDSSGPYACKSCVLSLNKKLILVDTLGHGKCGCKDGYFLDPAMNCAACDMHCLTCFGPSYQNCLTCSDVANLNPETKGCDCKPGYIWNKSYSKCVSTSSCASGQWLGITGCSPCMVSCLECMGPSASDCTKCSTSMLPVASYKDDTTQFYSCKCLENQYTDTTGKCTQCHQRCSTCYGPSEFQCASCPQNSYLDTSVAGQGQCKCIANFQRDASTGACSPIAINPDCAISEFKTSAGVCTACHQSCASCFDGNAQSCATCPSGADFIVLSSTTSTVIFGKCVCKPGSVLASGKCVACGGNCATCYGVSANQCATCKPNFTFDAGICTCLPPLALSGSNCTPVATSSVCGVNQYMSAAGQCQPCSTNCQTCVGPTDYDCVSCYADQLKTLKQSTAGTNLGTCVCRPGTYVAGGKCVECDNSCASCAGPLNTDCWSCRLAVMTYGGTTAAPGTCTCTAGSVWSATKSACVTACSTSQFLDGGGACVPCDPACSGCKGPGPDQCIACTASFDQTATTTALFFCKCAAGKYFTGTSCANCDNTKCAECVSAADNCVKCPDPNMALTNVSGKSSCQCKDGYTISGTTCNPVNQFGCPNINMYKDAAGACQSCDASCATCNGPSKYECVFCKRDAIRTASPVGSCVCPSGYFANADFTCTACTAPCTVCTATACLSCPVGRYPAALTCAACHQTCQSCTGNLDTNCVSCYANANLVSGKCVCADGYVQSTIATAPGCVLAPTSTVCQTNQFIDSTGKCNSCNTNCYTCTGPFDTNCVACNPGKNMVLQKVTTSGTLPVGKCVCAPNSFLDSVTSQCLPCDSSCLTCNGTGPDRCLTCPATVAVPVTTASGFRCNCASAYLLSPYTKKCEAKSAYDTGMWLDQNGQPQKCHYSCTKCVGPNPTDCIDCTGATRMKDPAAPATAMLWKCVCNSGFETMGGDCGVCTGLCNTCTGPDPGKCLSCKANSLLPATSTQGQCMCAANYKLDSAGVNCQPIVFDTTCTAAQYKNAAGTCTNCHASCGTCLGGSDSDCLTCSIAQTVFFPSTTQTPVTGKCLCKSGFFWSSTSCTACSAGCLECTSATVCTRCNATFNLASNACACPTGYTLSGTTCNPTAVTTCSSTQGMYAESTTSCLPCHPSCLNCVGPTYTDCLSCKELTLRLTVVNAASNSGNCGCQPGTFLASGVCQQCGPKCATCSTTAAACVTCRSGFTLTGTDCTCSAGIYDPVKNVCINTSLCTAGNYPDPPNSTATTDCKPCTAPCATCIAAGNKACLSCLSGMTAVSTGQGTTMECQCLAGFYYNPTTNACTACSTTCATCTGSPNNCLACPSGTNRELVSTGLTGTCNCKFGYQDVSGQCTPTASGACGIGTWNNAGTCTNCFSTCQSCVGGTNASCLICKSADMKPVDTDSNQANGVSCVCQDGLYWTGTACAQCPISCKTCSSATTCTSCKDGNDLSAAGACQCKFGFTFIATIGACSPPSSSSGCNYNQYLSTAVSPAVCKSCDSMCLTCNGPGPDQCNQCGQNAGLDANKLCVCNAGFYFSLTNFACVACDATCLKCKGPGATSCTACITNKHVDGTGACVCDTGFTASGTECKLTTQGSCLANQYLVGTTCTNCNTACANCSGSAATDCIVCATGYVKDASNACVCKGFLTGTTCTPCHQSCLTCDGGTSANCLSCASTATLSNKVCTCKSGYYVDSSGTCILIPACPAKAYFDLNMRSCQPCYFMCATCNGPTYDKCLTCITGSTGTAVTGSGTNCQCNTGMYYAQMKGMCVTIPTCTSGTFLDTGLYECKACDVQCKECKNATAQGCSACNTGLTLWTTGECKCADGNFFSRTDGKCVTCHSNCLLCYGPNNNSCTKCAVGFVMNSLKACVCDVQNSFYITATTKECKACNSACLTCIDSANDKCTSCKPRSKLVVANLGVDTFGVCSCDDNSYFDTTAGACIEKPGSCYGSTFVSQTSTISFQCIPCHKSCLQCTDVNATDCLQCPADRKFVKNTVPSTYTGPITGKCECKFTNALDPTKCDAIECPAGFFYDTRSTVMAAVCTACHPTCKTCVGATESDCRSCADNRKPRGSDGFFRTICDCRSEFLYPDNTCGMEMFVNQTATGCPLNQALCANSPCKYTTSGSLIRPATDACMKSIYDYCCFSAGRTQCANLGVPFDQCDKIAPPSVAPSSVGYFSEDGMRVTIKFSAPANFLKKDCGALFTNPLALTSSSCQFPENSSVLMIYLSADHSLVPSTTATTTATGSTTASVRTSTLTLRSGVYMSTHPWATSTNAETAITLKAPATATPVNLQVTYPAVVSKCMPNVHFDASASTGGGTRPLAFKWTVPTATATIVMDTARPDQADLKNFGKLATDSIIVTVTATSFLGQSATKDLTIKFLAGLAPQVSIPFDYFTLNPSKEFSVYMKAVAPGCTDSTGAIASSSTFTYQWSLDSSSVSSTSTSASTSTTLNSSTEPMKLVLQPNVLTPGGVYVFKAGASMDGITWGYAYLKIAATNPGLKVKVSGGNRDVSIKEMVTLGTERSSDPLTPTVSVRTDWTFKWTCEDWTSFGATNPVYADGVDDTTMDQSIFTTYSTFAYKDCTDASNAPLMSGLKIAQESLVIPAGAIPANRTYYFKATATKGTRSGFGYSFLRTKPSSRTGKVEIQYTGTNLNATGINSLYCLTDCTTGCSLRWNLLTPNVNVKWLSTDFSRPGIAFRGEGLMSDTVYRFECVSSVLSDSLSAIAELSLNSAPSGGVFEMTPYEGNITTVFTATFSNWVDKEQNYPITYKLWLRDGTAQTLLRVSDNSRIEGLTLPAAVNRSMFLVSSEICDSLNNCRVSDNRYIKIEPLTATSATAAVGNLIGDYGRGRDNMNRQERNGALSIVVQTVSQTVGVLDSAVVANVLNTVNTECTASTLAQESNSLTQCVGMYQGLAAAINDTTQVTAPLLGVLNVMASSNTAPTTETANSVLETIGALRERNANDPTAAPVETDALMGKLGDAILANTPTSARVELQTSTTAATFENKDSDDMLKNGASFTAPSAVTVDNSTREGRRLQSAGRYQITLPSCMVPKLTNNATYRVRYWTSSKSDYTFSADRNRSSYDSDLQVTDSVGSTLLIKNESCSEPIVICSQFLPPVGFTPPQAGTYNPATGNYGDYALAPNTTAPHNLTDWKFRCQYWDTTNKLWSEDGVLQNETVIFWSNLTICCKTMHLTTYSTGASYRTPAAFSPMPDEPRPMYGEHHDNYEEWDHFTGFYVAVILVGVEVFLVFVGLLADTFDGRKRRDGKPTVTSPSGIINSHEVKDTQAMADVQAFEAPELKEFEGDIKKLQDQTIAGADTPNTHSDAQPVVADPSFCRFFLYNFFLTGFAIKHKPCYSRSARAAQMCSVLLIELFITGLLTPVHRMRHVVHPALIAVGITLPASPLLVLGLYTPGGLSKCTRVVKVGFAAVLAILVIFGSLGACAYSADTLGSGDITFWMKAFGVAVGLELIASQALKVLLKFALFKCSKPNTAFRKVMAEV